MIQLEVEILYYSNIYFDFLDIRKFIEIQTEIQEESSNEVHLRLAWLPHAQPD
jgi:hypothetical protein